MINENDAEARIRRTWVQGIIANYSSTNVNGSHMIARVEEFPGFTEIDIMSLFPYLQYVQAFGEEIAHTISNEMCKITIRVETPMTRLENQ